MRLVGRQPGRSDQELPSGTDYSGWRPTTGYAINRNCPAASIPGSPSRALAAADRFPVPVDPDRNLSFQRAWARSCGGFRPSQRGKGGIVQAELAGGSADVLLPAGRGRRTSEEAWGRADTKLRSAALDPFSAAHPFEDRVASRNGGVGRVGRLGPGRWPGPYEPPVDRDLVEAARAPRHTEAGPGPRAGQQVHSRGRSALVCSAGGNTFRPPCERPPLPGPPLGAPAEPGCAGGGRSSRRQRRRPGRQKPGRPRRSPASARRGGVEGRSPQLSAAGAARPG